ncbi:hypothetical protein C0Q70_13890 [Pomacea canaliculata]|uniref:Uncharacterized protein n=2 Tax=Pomacea canaliculata TaxID=400727 RepID=A0A2T7NYH1_POMCA|nr:hypothetical protein C0Q70_13890 [Pomacea canaliculata]
MSKNSNVGDAFPSALSFSTVSYANDYLTTTRRPLASLPPVPECSTNANAIDHTGESFTRIDSGFESAPPSPPSREVAAAVNRTSSTYEYINPRDLYLHPLPVRRCSGHCEGESNSSARTTATVTTITNSSFPNTDSDLDDAVHFQRSARQISNQMYQCLQRADTQRFPKQSHCIYRMTLEKQVRCLWLALVILIVITVLVLVLSAYTLFGAIADIQIHLHNKDKQIQSMESEYLTLSNKIGFMKYVRSGNESYLPDTEWAALYVKEAQSYLGTNLSSFTLELQNMNISLQTQLQEIIHIAGPQGPPGAGNLSMCTYQNFTGSVGMGGGSSYTSYVPSLETLEDKIVMSVACDVQGGTQQSVETNVLSANKFQYRCKCDGTTPSATHRLCIIHYLLCPRLS